MIPSSVQRLYRMRDRLGIKGTIQFTLEDPRPGRKRRMQYALYTLSGITILGYSCGAARQALRALAKEASNATG